MQIKYLKIDILHYLKDNLLKMFNCHFELSEKVYLIYGLIISTFVINYTTGNNCRTHKFAVELSL